MERLRGKFRFPRRRDTFEFLKGENSSQSHLDCFTEFFSEILKIRKPLGGLQRRRGWQMPRSNSEEGKTKRNVQTRPIYADLQRTEQRYFSLGFAVSHGIKFLLDSGTPISPYKPRELRIHLGGSMKSVERGQLRFFILADSWIISQMLMRIESYGNSSLSKDFTSISQCNLSGILGTMLGPVWF